MKSAYAMPQPGAFLLAVIIAAPLLHVQASLRTALDKATGVASAPPLPKAPSSPLVITLKRLSARSEVDKGSFFSGKVAVGYPPQELDVLFDTGSGHVLIPHRACKSRACEEHRHYSPWQSVTSMDVDVHGHQLQKEHRLAKGNATRDGVVVDFTQADLGQGVAHGVFVRDRVCLVGQSGGEVCAELAVMAAVTEEDVPFREMPNDGIVGLALPSLSASPACNFFGTLVEGAQGMLPQFGISLGATGGELHIGGHDPASVAAPIQWFPVHSPEEGYWQVPILAVRVGKTTIDACHNGCHAIMDTASSRLGVQKSNLPKLLEALTPVQSADGSCQGPNLEFDLGGMSITLGIGTT